MQPERWQQIDQLFHQALDQERGRRAMFLAQACAGDDALRSEIEDLISSHEEAEDFIESPASDLAAELLAQGQSGLKVGEKIGPHQVEGVLGIGGMGEVYLATDTRLARRVALKLLPPQFTLDPERVRRFEQEARAASALNHPNIVTIYEIGRLNSTQFIVTEFVEGQTLRQLMNKEPFTLNEALNVAIQVAGALGAAHAAGIVHRDIKPENIMLRSDGYVKILDFGLAKLTEAPPSDSELETSTLLQSNAGLVMGTVQYMSPEQARGKKIDGRTDIWSFGVVLYELLSGRVPFSGETPSHVMVSIMENELPRLTEYTKVPAELDRIVTKTLSKNKKERYQTARELAHDLKNLKRELQLEDRLKQSLEAGASGKETTTKSDTRKAVGPRPAITARTVDIGIAHPTSSAEYLVSEIKLHKRGVFLATAAVIIATMAVGYFFFTRSRNVASSNEAIDSVAVLPFVNVNNDPNTEYLSDGISDSIINNLSRLPALKVMSLNLVLRYKGKQTDPQVIGKAMNVRAVLLGRLTQQGDNLIISTELVDVRDNRRLWGEQYNRKLSDILVVQNEIAREIAERLRLQLSSQDKKQLSRSYTENAQAYQLYSLGMYKAREGTRDGAEKGIEYFDQAIKLDPNYALAYAGYFYAYYILGNKGYWVPKEARQKIEWAALKSVELDDTLPQAHLALAYVRKMNWDWAGSEKEQKRALELDPNLFEANASYEYLLVDVGRLDEALVYAKRAEELGGADALAAQAVPYVYFHQRQYDAAIDLYLKARERYPKNVQLHFFFAEAYVANRMYEEGIAEMRKALEIDNAPERHGGYPMLAYAYAMAGKRSEALKILHEQEQAAKERYISPYNFAMIYTGLGDKNRAFEYLNEALDERAQPLVHLKSRPVWDPLRSDPRYAELLRRINLTP